MKLAHGPTLLQDIASKITDLHISQSLYETTGIEISFLEEPVEKWPEMESFQSGAKSVRFIPCTNDCAERGVALIQQINTMTIDEGQKQYLLQVVEQNRKCYLHVIKRTLLTFNINI